MQNNYLNLAYIISKNCCFLVKVIKQLEILNLTINDSLAIVEMQVNKLNKVQRESGVIIKQLIKLHTRFE